MAKQSDDDALEQRLLELVERRLRVEATLDTPLTGLGVDSLRLADFVTDLERHFDLDADQDLFAGRARGLHPRPPPRLIGHGAPAHAAPQAVDRSRLRASGRARLCC